MRWLAPSPVKRPAAKHKGPIDDATNFLIPDGQLGHGGCVIRLLVIVPYPDMESTVRKVLGRHPRRDALSVRVVVSSVDDLDLVDMGGCDAIIARGYTAHALVTKALDMPLVELGITAYDVLRALQECQRVHNPQVVGFVGFYGALSGIEQFAGMLGCRVHVWIPPDASHMASILDQAVAADCEVIIGGYSAYLQAKKRGLRAFLIRSGEEAFAAALDEAARAVELVRQERLKTRIHQIITQSARVGILYVDAEGIIQVDNDAARQLAVEAGAMRHADVLVGKELARVFPSMAASYTANRASGNTKGHVTPWQGELRQEGPVTLSLDGTPVAPVSVDGRPAGVVFSFQNIAKVQQLEGHIRKHLSARGLVARHHFEDIIHRSSVIAETIENARRYAASSSNILIVGETGTGKELFAQSIHNASSRRDGPFVAVNCAALPENLLESELFGYVEGAFTGTARGGKEGLFELAHNGSLFLDEISEMAPTMHSKLLRVLQEREVRRVGGNKVIAVDVRIISATNRNLYELVSAGLFRQDLLYRLDVLKIFLPPLNRRQDDVAELFHFFLRSFALRRHEPVPTVEPGAMELLLSYRFVGNARELRNIVERVGVLMRLPHVITAEDMERALYPEDIESAEAETPQRQKRRSEDDILRRAVAECGGNQTRAARMLGIDRTTLWRRLRKLGLRPQ